MWIYRMKNLGISLDVENVPFQKRQQSQDHRLLNGGLVKREDFFARSDVFDK
jgi:hypothetical protein